MEDCLLAPARGTRRDRRQTPHVEFSLPHRMMKKVRTDEQMENNLEFKRLMTQVELPDKPPTSLRQFERRVVSICVLCHAHGSFNTVHISNISCGGAALRGCKSFMPGDVVRLEFLNRRRIEAVVRWWFNGNCGVQFTEEIDPFDPLLLDRNRTQ